MHRQITTKCAILSKSKLFCELKTTSNEHWEHKKRNGNSKDKLAYVTSWSALRRPLRQMHFDKACCTTGLALSGLALARSKRWFFLRMVQLPSDEITWEFGRDGRPNKFREVRVFLHFLLSSLITATHGSRILGVCLVAPTRTIVHPITSLWYYYRKLLWK